METAGKNHQGKIVVAADAVSVLAEDKQEETAAVEVEVEMEEQAAPTALKSSAKKQTATGNVATLLGDDDLFEGLDEVEGVADEDSSEEEVSLLEGEEGDEEEGAESEAAESIENDNEEAEDADSDVGVMTIYQVKCLRCTHLVPELSDDTNPKGKEFKGCHYENGNEDCPAQWATIVVGIPVDKIVTAIMEAEEAGNTEKLGAIYAKLASKDEAQQAEVHRKLALARKQAA